MCGDAAPASGERRKRRSGGRLVVSAPRLFDGRHLLRDHAVAIAGDSIVAVAPAERLRKMGPVIRLPGGTVLPGFIDLHSHLLLQAVPAHHVLRHGVTTVRDLGGPLVPPSGGDGRLRVVAAGPILTAPGGYPISVFGAASAVEVADEQAARAAVDTVVDGGAALVKVALEPGGSPGAPWTRGHRPPVPPPWPLLPLPVLRAIVDRAHAKGRVVSAHLSGVEGIALALEAAVDEWAHVPCDPIPAGLVARAAAAGVKVIGTLDTQSHCPGVLDNARQLVKAGVRLLYGTDLAHTDVPWGINAEELHLMLHTAQGAVTPLEVLSAATQRAGEHLGQAPLGRLVEGAPADLVGVRGDPLVRLKLLEYPDLVISGGVVVVAPDDDPGT